MKFKRIKPSHVFAEKSLNTHHADVGFVVAIILLSGLGLVSLFISSANYAQMQFGSSFYFVKRQLISFAIGFVLLAITSVVNFDFIRKCLPFIYIGTFILCVLTFIPGIASPRNEAHRWIKFPLIGTFQPSELAKFAVILFLANWFEKNDSRMNDGSFHIVQMVLGLFCFVLVVFLQNDFSTAFFIMLVGLVMFFMAGLKITWFVSFCVFMLPIVILFIFTKAYRVNRLIAFFNPEKYSHGINYQVNAAERAISSGRFFGEGFGAGLKRIASVPESQSDFVFAGWAEAMGFFGVLIFFGLVLFFAYRGYLIAFRCKEKCGSYAAFGIVTCIVLQILFNCGVVVGALPATGIPLPFFSSGGSSLLVTLLMCGVVINISKFDNKSLESDDYE